jgi:hypothetical protein
MNRVWAGVCVLAIVAVGSPVPSAAGAQPEASGMSVSTSTFCSKIQKLHLLDLPLRPSTAAGFRKVAAKLRALAKSAPDARGRRTMTRLVSMLSRNQGPLTAWPFHQRAQFLILVGVIDNFYGDFGIECP